MDWPSWWEWDLALSTHVRKRMEDRGFSEVELREMLEDAGAYRLDVIDGRWVIETRHRKTSWEVIVEPDSNVERLIVVTAYAVGE
jgi:hypothetical protein